MTAEIGRLRSALEALARGLGEIARLKAALTV
jgi:hypothetical protein